ncbi:hemin uptake protein HemP [Undibacter mobilis]|uniref:Hemin uptake protein HemP n=1 Tax=Undibacter mobilis TaxID=2292256 RepID=A0A371B7J2_9BRAD|nr:hemin uptake protein HemP [Undibacter mobilis]RDV03569.1 hemin uptake protein HemP [Undibacter mobilis]
MNDEKPLGGASNGAPGASQTGSPRGVSLRDNRVDSRELFNGTREITIAHGDETYRLRLTAQNKLILTK